MRKKEKKMKTIEIQVFNEKTGSYEDKQMDALQMIEYAKENTHGSATYAYAVHSYLKELGYDFSLKYANQITNQAMIAVYGKDNLSKKQINLGAAGNSYTYKLREDFENGIVDFQAVKDLIASDISAWQIESDTGISRTTIGNYRNGKASLLNMTVKNAMILTSYTEKLKDK